MCAALSSYPLHGAGATGTPGQLVKMFSYNILAYPGLQPILILCWVINLNLEKPIPPGFVVFVWE